MAKRYWPAYRQALQVSDDDPIEEIAKALGALADALQPLVRQAEHPADGHRLGEACGRLRRTQRLLLAWLEQHPQG